MGILCRATFALIVLAYAPVHAHHATAAEFDTSKLIVLQGAIKDIEWINPHAWLRLDVKDADGKITTWRIEGASMNAYDIRKFPRESVVAGLEISITAYPARNGDHTADGATIIFKDGKRVFFGGSAPIDGLDQNGQPCIINAKNSACRQTL